MSSRASKAQIRIGTRHEKEHTKNTQLAKKIACDHLREHPKYYTYLKRMEKQMNKDEKKKGRKKR